MIRGTSTSKKLLSAIAIASLALALCIGFLWIRNQLAIHELQTRLRAADLAPLQSEEAVGGPSFPVEPLGLRLSNLTVRSARDAGLEIASVRSSPVTSERIGNNMYQTTRVSIQVTGDVNEIVAFLDLLEVGAISSMAVDDIELEWTGRWEVSVDVLAYTLPG